MCRTGLDIAQQALSPREPTVARRLVPDRLDVFPAEPERDACGPRCIASLAERRVGLFPMVDRPVDVAEPPERPPEPV